MLYHVCMKKSGLLIFLLLCFVSLPCFAKNSDSPAVEGNKPKIFRYHITDDDIKSQDEGETAEQVSENSQEPVQKPDITSDDVTADTSGEEIAEDDTDDETLEEPEIEEYQIDDLYTDVLKGYAQYDEDEEDAVSLSDSFSDFHTIKLTKPVKVEAKKYTADIHTLPTLYSSLNSMEYSIAPVSAKSSAKKGGFSAGTTYNQGIDIAELEQSPGLFSQYESKYFAVSTSYARTINSTNNNYNDNVYFSPELIFNQYFSLREVLSADIVKNRKTAEMILSINPFGKKDTDRLRFELGASSIYDDKNALLKKQFKFSTRFQL